MADDVPSTPSLLILCRDLLLGSKITSAAQSAGVAYKVVRDAAKLAGTAGGRLIVDLNQEGALDAAAAWRQETGAVVVGFASHVDTQTIQRARAAGLDEILPRSRFVADLPSIINHGVV